ncbi:heptosyltransferase [Oceanidesulfovibrio marinus]|uniref:Heptosyltransferase n=2 Tax=Oceanidesulfovibrio marinus TaxID=370038 RepID=A0A6P1ZJY5_9BACT|nr:heptosyltransferase [Oceanidesulfovibrio marinus]
MRGNIRIRRQNQSPVAMAFTSLVIQLARFGDLVQTARLMRSLSGPGASVHLACDASLAGLAGILYPEATIHPVRAHGGRQSPGELLAANAAAFEAIRAAEPDAVYNLNFSGLNFALASMFDEDVVHGYFTHAGQRLKDPWPEVGFRLSSRRPQAPCNLVDLWAHFAENPIAPEAVFPGAVLESPETREPGNSGGLGVVLAGRHSRRSLPAEVLAPMAAAALEGVIARSGQGDAKAYLLGTNAEKPLAKAFLRAASPRLAQRVEDRTGSMDLAGLASFLRGLDLVLTPDTGTMHLAAALGTPVMACFLSSAWAWETGPYGTGHLVWQSAPPCAPCLEAQECPNELTCLEPFTAPKFLKNVAAAAAGREVRGDELPESLLLLRGSQDGFGQTYDVLAGQDPYAAERAALRREIAMLRGVVLKSDAPPLNDQLTRLMFREQDWMLPPWRDRA